MKNLAIRKDGGGQYQVIEISESLDRWGDMRRYSSTLGDSKYKTAKGAERAARRWLSLFCFDKYVGEVDKEMYRGEIKQ